MNRLPAIMCLLLANYADSRHAPGSLQLVVAKEALGSSMSLRNDEMDEDAGYEWSGLFHTEDRMHLWSAQRVDGEYADATMKLVVLSASNETAEALDDLTPMGKRLFEEQCRPAKYLLVKAGATITPDQNACYMMEFDSEAWQTLFKVNTASSPYTAFFAEHLPTEFTSGSHYLKDTAGDDVLPAVEALAGTADMPAGAKPWGTAIGAAIVINLVTLAGVASAIPAMMKLSRRCESEFAVLVSAFAAGALLSCAFNILLFEASHLIAEGGFEDETAVTWRWATMILAGFLASTCIDCCIGFVVRESQVDPAGPALAQPVGAIIVHDPDSTALPVLDEGAKSPATIETPSLRKRARLVSGVLIGDFFHNLCDGMFVGAAFNVCGGDMGWSVAAATVIHEVAQELSDYSILVSPTQGGLRPLHALALNFTSGLSVIIGVVIVLTSDVSSFSIGLMLAFGGGVYIHIGATECMPRVYSLPVAPAVRLLALLAFILGAVAIALVLLNHEHCSADTAAAAGAHTGHSH